MLFDIESWLAALCVVLMLAIAYTVTMLVFVFIPQYKRNLQRRKEMEETAKRIRAGAIQRPSNRWYVHGINVIPPNKK